MYWSLAQHECVCVEYSYVPFHKASIVMTEDIWGQVHQNPSSSTRSFLTQGILWHEIIGGLDTDAHVLLVRAVWQIDALPKVRTLGIVLGVVELFDADLVHVSLLGREPHTLCISYSGYYHLNFNEWVAMGEWVASCFSWFEWAFRFRAELRNTWPHWLAKDQGVEVRNR